MQQVLKEQFLDIVEYTIQFIGNPQLDRVD